MMPNKKIILLFYFGISLFCTIFISVKCQAQNSLDSSQTKRFQLSVLPFAYYSPETSAAFGLMLIGLRKPVRNDSLSRDSNYSLSLTYTAKKQIISELLFSHITKNDLYRFTGNLTYRKFPMKYFGIGNDRPDNLQEVIPQEIFDFHFRAYREIAPSFYTGLAGRFNVLYNTSTKENSIYAEEIANSEGVSEGIGTILVYDKRDHLLSPHTGFYLEMNAYFYRTFLTGKHQFTELFFDARKYFHPVPYYVFAGRLNVRSVHGDVPFHLYPRLGGEFLMRGYYDGRFRDKNILVLQTEHRFRLRPKWWLTVFASTAQVAPSVAYFDWHRTKFVAGFGLRYALKTKGRVYIRLDFGFGNGSQGIYSGLNDIY